NISSACNATNSADEYESVSTANYFTEGVGWFYYSQTNPCSTYFGGLTDTALGLVSMTSLGAIAGPFPTLRSQAAFGMGDYVGAIKRGLPGGYLFPTWTQPITTTYANACIPCQSLKKNVAIFGTRVTP